MSRPSPYLRVPGHGECHGKEPTYPATGRRRESAELVFRGQGRSDSAIEALGHGLLCISEAAALNWGDVEWKGNGSAFISLSRSKKQQKARVVVLRISKQVRSPGEITQEGWLVASRLKAWLNGYTGIGKFI